jgi:hypothetical protein
MIVSALSKDDWNLWNGRFFQRDVTTTGFFQWDESTAGSVERDLECAQLPHGRRCGIFDSSASW